MQPDWPMPFANTGLAAPNNFTNSAGVFDYTSGTATTTLTGRYVRMSRHLRRHQRQLGHRRHRPGRRQRPARLHDGRRGGRQHPRLALRLLRAQQAGRAGPRLAADATPGCSDAAHRQRQHQPDLQRFWNAAAPSTSTAPAAAAGTPARSRPCSTTSGATAWTTTTPTARSPTPARATPTSRPSTACRPPASATASSRPDDGCGLTADGTGFNTNEAQTGAAHCDTDCSGVRDADWAEAQPEHAGHRARLRLHVLHHRHRALRPAGALRGRARRARRPGTSWPAT